MTLSRKIEDAYALIISSRMSEPKPSLEALEDELQQLITKAHNPKLAEEDGHVTQVWNDGETTSQKSGELLWNRSLHTLQFPLNPPINIKMPIVFSDKNQTSYAFVTSEDAYKIRQLMAKVAEAHKH
jgi:hypothetical protein